jgi:hypothetical protein
MNASLLTADSGTHLKVVVMGLSAALLVVMLALAVH